MKQVLENSVYFLVLAQFPRIFDPQLVESTEANLLIEGCLAHTSQKHILAKEEEAWGYFFPRHLFLEENAQGPSLNMGGVNPHGLSAGLW